jgi:hypothetical protein
MRPTGKEIRKAFDSSCDIDDFAELSFFYRRAGSKLAEAASRVIRDWDGVHRLSRELARWYQGVANERRFMKKPVKK